MTDTYKARLRVPTHEQYAYIEIDAEGTPESLYEAYSAFTRIVQVGEGLHPKEWNAVLDKYLDGESMSADQHERMNKAQSWMIHELDKAFSRKSRT